MQLFARDAKDQIISAARAAKQRDYFCRECSEIVRVRGGLHRQSHFFHLKITSACRQNGKSLVHLQIQSYLQKLLTPDQLHLEYRFKEINRIADAVWLSEKIVFEVQCSPISSQEIEERNRDYTSQGYQVVWILHDSRYNQRKLTAAEMFLLHQPHYFTNIDFQGEGIIYDQLAFFDRGFRNIAFNHLKVSVLGVKSALEYGSYPQTVQERLKRSRFYFEGDLIDLCQEEAFLEQLKQKELEFRRLMGGEKSVFRFLKILVERWVIKPYMNFFQMFLELVCR